MAAYGPWPSSAFIEGSVHAEPEQLLPGPWLWLPADAIALKPLRGQDLALRRQDYEVGSGETVKVSGRGIHRRHSTHDMDEPRRAAKGVF